MRRYNLEDAYYDPGTEAFAEIEDHETTSTIMRGGMLMFASGVLDTAVQEDFSRAGDKMIESRKVAYLSTEVGDEFARLKLLPSVSDKASDHDANESNVTFVKMRNNVLFGSREVYIFVPDPTAHDLRDPEFQSPRVIFIIFNGARGEQEIFAITEDQAIQLNSLSQAKDLIEKLKVNTSIAEQDIPAETLDRVYNTLVNSRLVDQEDRDPLAGS